MESGIIAAIPVAAVLVLWWTQTREPGPLSRKTKVTLACGTGAAVLLACFLAAFHIVHGGGMGWHLCKKYGWTFDDTFVDMGSLKGGDVSPKLGHALDRCLK